MVILPLARGWLTLCSLEPLPDWPLSTAPLVGYGIVANLSCAILVPHLGTRQLIAPIRTSVVCQQEGHFARNCPNPWGINVFDSFWGSSSCAPADGETSRDVDPSGSQDSPGAPANDGAHLVSSLDAGSPGAHTPPQVILPGGSSDPPLGSHVTNAVHDSSNGGTQSGSSLDAGSSGVQTSPQAILPSGSSDLPVDPHSSAQVVQQQPGQPLQTDNQDVFVDASDGSDIEEFPQSSLSSSQTISEFSQSQSILCNAQDVQNNSVVPGTVVVLL